MGCFSFFKETPEAHADNNMSDHAENYCSFWHLHKLDGLY